MLSVSRAWGVQTLAQTLKQRCLSSILMLGGRGTQRRGDRVNPRVVAQLVSSEFNKGPSLKNKLESRCLISAHTQTLQLEAPYPCSGMFQSGKQSAGGSAPETHRGHLPHGNYQHQV